MFSSLKRKYSNRHKIDQSEYKVLIDQFFIFFYFIFIFLNFFIHVSNLFTFCEQNFSTMRGRTNFQTLKTLFTKNESNSLNMKLSNIAKIGSQNVNGAMQRIRRALLGRVFHSPFFQFKAVLQLPILQLI